MCVHSIPKRGWSKHTKGYLIWTSRGTARKIERGHYLHRAIVEEVSGVPIPMGMEVQHLWPFNKATRDPHQLMIAPPEFNPTGARRCPYTGRYMAIWEWERDFGACSAIPAEAVT
jgi:hypothetical protein